MDVRTATSRRVPLVWREVEVVEECSKSSRVTLRIISFCVQPALYHPRSLSSREQTEQASITRNTHVCIAQHRAAQHNQKIPGALGRALIAARVVHYVLFLGPHACALASTQNTGSPSFLEYTPGIIPAPLPALPAERASTRSAADMTVHIIVRDRRRYIYC